MAYFQQEVDIEIDVNDYYEEMSKTEKQHMKKLLHETIDFSEFDFNELNDEQVIKDFVYNLCNSSQTVNLDLMINEIKYYQGNK